jgi:hypothetical protein
VDLDRARTVTRSLLVSFDGTYYHDSFQRGIKHDSFQRGIKRSPLIPSLLNDCGRRRRFGSLSLVLGLNAGTNVPHPCGGRTYTSKTMWRCSSAVEAEGHMRVDLGA